MPISPMLSQLQNLARTGGEIRFADRGDGAAFEARSATWGERFIRLFKPSYHRTGADRAEFQAAKDQTRAAMIEAFGPVIGERAFRAGIGKSDGHGGWAFPSADKPLTGRDIRKMMEAGRKELSAGHDVLRMRQISVGGMAGLSSKGVCAAATMDWFRRIDKGLPTWRHHHDGTGQVVQRDTVDWVRKRSRLQTMQDSIIHGRGIQDSRFAGVSYIPGYPDGRALLNEGPVGFDEAVLLGEDILAKADQMLATPSPPGAPPPNAFLRLNIDLAGRVAGRVSHTIGLHVERPTDGGERQVHVFDSNRREAVVPASRFGAWLASHFHESYGNRVVGYNTMTITRTAYEPPPPTTATTGGSVAGQDDFSFL